MTVKARVVIPDKEWLIRAGDQKIGALLKDESGFSLFKKGNRVDVGDLTKVTDQFGADLFKESIDSKRPQSAQPQPFSIYNYPCKCNPYNPIYDVKKKLPMYAKSETSKSLFCAGYYLVLFNKGWVTAFCPKLITLERYQFVGPFKTEQELKCALEKVSKNEAT